MLATGPKRKTEKKDERKARIDERKGREKRGVERRSGKEGKKRKKRKVKAPTGSLMKRYPGKVSCSGVLENHSVHPPRTERGENERERERQIPV